MAENQGAEEPRRAYVIGTVATASRSDAAPAPRGGATLTQIDSGEVYLIGGANREAQSFGDVYRFDFETERWSAVTAEGRFPARSGHSAVAVGSRIVVFGGMNPIECVVYEDVHVFDTREGKWTKPLVEGWMPGARNAQATIRLPSDDGHDRVLIYGGSSPEEGPFDDVYILHIPVGDAEAPLRWERCECVGPEIPEARELHVASYLTPTTVLFSGGRNRDGSVCTDMAVLEITTWQWQLVPICEWNRCSHAAAAVDGAVVSFGGFDGGAIRGDCWEYADNEESWLRVEVQGRTAKKKRSAEPESNADSVVVERFGHCGCSVTIPATSEASGKRRDGLLIFGGMNAERDLNDLVLITRAPEKE